VPQRVAGRDVEVPGGAPGDAAGEGDRRQHHESERHAGRAGHFAPVLEEGGVVDGVLGALEVGEDVVVLAVGEGSSLAHPCQRRRDSWSGDGRGGQRSVARWSAMRPIASVSTSVSGRVTSRKWSGSNQLKPVPWVTRIFFDRSRSMTNSSSSSMW